MFPFIRMNQIYGKMEPPDMGGGNVSSVVDYLLRKLKTEDTSMMPKTSPQVQSALPNIMSSYKGDPNVVLGPGALEQPRIGLEPDRGTLFGQDPKLAAKLQFDQQKLNQNLDFKRDQLEETDKYHQGLLDSRNTLGGEANRIRANRADIYRYKALNPDLVFRVSKGGNIFGLDPRTGESFDTGVDSGTLSEDEKLSILGEQKIDEINTRGDNSMNLQGARNEGALAQIAARTAGQKEVNAARPTREPLPTQTKVKQNLTAHQLVNEHPDLAKFITFNGDGTFSVSKNAPPDIASRINGVLYPKTDNTTQTTTTTKPKVETSNAPKAPAGWKYIRNATNTGWTAVEDKTSQDKKK